MKFGSLALLALASAAGAAPADGPGSSLVGRQSRLAAVTDQILFQLGLTAFTARRNKRDPPSVDWSSDGCTASPDNPFGFPFLPACHRHDFGYQNYRLQKRFTKAAKAKIDLNFKKDLYTQCQTVTATEACERLADVYYAAVVHFGGKDATKRDEAVAETTQETYDRAVAAYEDAVRRAQDEGLLPVLS
ncbi:hypothetical protein CDD83_9009 [Cordyceps sp. RAO-2017]|nr:hypothetical protein CDD83_9009 [Cordyceps sp. RAO-2017]